MNRITDDEISGQLGVRLYEKIWHDGTRWWAKDLDGHWQPTRTNGRIRLNFIEASRDISVGSIAWEKARYRIRTQAGLYAIAAIMKANMWTRPEDFTVDISPRS